MSYLLASFFISFFWCQSENEEIIISNFSYSNIQNIHLMLDEGGQNTFIFNKYYPFFMDDHANNTVLVDGSFQLPLGGYVFPKLFSFNAVPDSIKNISQIHYHKGDYSLGELGLSIKIRDEDGSKYGFHGSKKSPAIIHSSSSWNDNLQNYLFSYERDIDEGNLALDVMYHLEDFHLPLNSSAIDYSRQVESFHSGLKMNKIMNVLNFKIHPAFQVSNVNRDGISRSYFTGWYNEVFTFNVSHDYNLYLDHASKWIILENEDEMNEINFHFIKIGLEYNLGNFLIKAGMGAIDGFYEPEIELSWEGANYFFNLNRKHDVYIDLINLDKFKKNNIDISLFKVGYFNNYNKTSFDLFVVEDSLYQHMGFGSEIEINFDWLSLYQKGSVYNQGNVQKSPIEIFNYVNLFFSPNIWFWNDARYQPFFGAECTSIKHSGINIFNPTTVPIMTSNLIGQSHDSNIILIEFGLLVNRFKVSYQFISSEIIGNKNSNSNLTYPIESIKNLAIEWQFFN